MNIAIIIFSKKLFNVNLIDFSSSGISGSMSCHDKKMLIPLLYKKRGSLTNSSFVLVNPFFNLDNLKIFSYFRYFFGKKPKKCCFFIDGRKINKKENLSHILDKINKKIKEKKNNHAFFLILVINLKYIKFENQNIFQKFFTKQGINLKFFFFLDDIKFLNENLL